MIFAAHVNNEYETGRIMVRDGDVTAQSDTFSIRVRGNVGGQVGAGYRGSLAGMRNGLIIVDGTAGLEVGMRMRRGNRFRRCV